MVAQASFTFDEASPGFHGPIASVPVLSATKPVTPKATGVARHRLKHRDRLRQRFTEGGADAVPDYELLEMILYRAMPRGDTKPLAKDLLARFGDLNRVLAASEIRLKEVVRVGERVIFELKLTQAVGHRMARQGDRPPNPILLGSALGLLSNRDGAPRVGAISRPLSRPQERADRR